MTVTFSNPPPFLTRTPVLYHSNLNCALWTEMSCLKLCMAVYVRFHRTGIHSLEIHCSCRYYFGWCVVGWVSRWKGEYVVGQREDSSGSNCMHAFVCVATEMSHDKNNRSTYWKADLGSVCCLWLVCVDASVSQSTPAGLLVRCCHGDNIVLFCCCLFSQCIMHIRFYYNHQVKVFCCFSVVLFLRWLCVLTVLCFWSIMFWLWFGASIMFFLCVAFRIVLQTSCWVLLWGLHYVVIVLCIWIALFSSHNYV